MGKYAQLSQKLGTAGKMLGKWMQSMSQPNALLTKSVFFILSIIRRGISAKQKEAPARTPQVRPRAKNQETENRKCRAP